MKKAERECPPLLQYFLSVPFGAPTVSKQSLEHRQLIKKKNCVLGLLYKIFKMLHSDNSLLLKSGLVVAC